MIDESVTAAQLQELHTAGVRGARFNVAKRLGLAPNVTEFRRSIARIAELAWFAKVFSVEDQLLELAAEFDAVCVPVVVDHMASLHFLRGIAQPAAQLLAERLKNGNWRVKLSNAIVRAAPTRLGQRRAVRTAVFQSAPDRCSWGRDWPHVHYPRTLPSDAELVNLLRRYVGDDAGPKRVPVDNPARLFGFGV